MPSQIRRLFIFLIIVAVLFIFGRRLLVPKSFGEYGHYRAVAVDDILSQEMKYAGHQVCTDCHEDIAAKKTKSYHKNVNCETCHGPALSHIESSGEILPEANRERGYCSLCHEYNPARPTGFAQIDPIAHNPTKRCILCHNPHAPDPPRTPNQCTACHLSIFKTKALSPHALLECTDCHETPALHFSQPRENIAGKPSTREDCLKCHGDNAESDQFIPRVDQTMHGEANFCWQCHYPHFPETR